jgi:hypothetical protein
VKDDLFGDHKNPFSEDPPGAANPYASPAPVDSRRPMGSEEIREQLRIPAICLMVMAVLSVIWRVVDFVFCMLLLANARPDDSPRLIGGLIGDAVATILLIITIIGCNSMLKLRSIESARSAAIISCIPCCSPCLVFGIPFGIWALVILNKPEAKRAFDA